MKYNHTKTNIPQENDYPKLVRDKIPQIIKEHNGVDVDIEIVKNTNKHFKYLQKKIVEEANELKEAKSREHIVEEIVDVLLKVINAKSTIKNKSKEALEELKIKKDKNEVVFWVELL